MKDEGVLLLYSLIAFQSSNNYSSYNLAYNLFSINTSCLVFQIYLCTSTCSKRCSPGLQAMLRNPDLENNTMSCTMPNIGMQRILVLNTLWHPISSGKLNEFKSMQCIQLSKQFTHRQTHTTDDHLCMCNECGGAKSWIFQPSRMPLLLYNDYTYACTGIGRWFQV